MELPQGYELVEPLYDGSRSSVARARRVADGATVVLKQTMGKSVTAHQLTRYRNEFDLLQSVDSPHVIKADDLVRTGGRLTMILEDFPGAPVKSWREIERPELLEMLRFAVSAAEAVGDVHAAGIIHKDVTAHNVLYDVASRRCKLIDFGIASRLSTKGSSLRQPESLEGTLSYIAPEQTGRMNRGVDYRADWYSLGITLYELFAGRLPKESDDPLQMVHFHLAGRPEAPSEVDSLVPTQVSDIIMKLIQKSPDDRYQSASGLVLDLKRCIEELEQSGSIAAFPLGSGDVVENFEFSQRLYGREGGTKAMADVFGRVAEGSVEVLLISGEAGVGKTALAYELYEPAARAGGFFVSGHHDEQVGDRPFSALLDAVQELISQVLTEPEEATARWREKLRIALGEHAAVLTEAIPALEHLLGPQPAAPQLPGVEAQNRFKRLFQNLISVFARSAHPVVMLLDNLQWADSDSLELISTVLAVHSGGALLVIGVYRDDDAAATERLLVFAEELETRGIPVQSIELSPLRSECVGQLIADTLHLDTERAAPLARVVHEKTRGNPFFARQFLRTLYDSELIRFDASTRSFGYDLEAIRAADITENVAEFLTGTLERLPINTRDALVAASAIGLEFDLGTIALALDGSEAEVARLLEPALTSRIILPISRVESLDPNDLHSPLVYRHFAFAHGRIHHAAYEFLTGKAKASLHLRLGRAILERTDEGDVRHRHFEIVNHVNHGIDLVDDPEERRRFAELNFEAGNRARSTTAYPLAARCYEFVIAYLGGEDGWTAARELTAEANERLAESLILAGRLEDALAVIERALAKRKSRIGRAGLHALKIQAFMGKAQMPEALAYGVEAARDIGLAIPTVDEGFAEVAGEALQTVLIKTSEIGVRSLLDLPQLTDPGILATMKLLTACLPPAFQTDHQLYTLLCCKLVLLSLENGNCPISARAYSSFGALLSVGLAKHSEANEFTRLGAELAEKFGDTSVYAAVYFLRAAFTSHWVEPLEISISLYKAGTEYGLQTGDHTHAAYSEARRFSHLQQQGMQLEDLCQEAEKTFGFFKQIGEAANVPFVDGRQRLARWLMGQRACGDTLGTEDSSEEEFTAELKASGNLSFESDWYAILIQQRYFACDYEAAHRVAVESEGTVPFSSPFIAHQERTFFHALTLAELLSSDEPRSAPALRSQFESYLPELRRWAEICPENFEHMRVLVEAEQARIDDDDALAYQLYEQAVEIASERGLAHFEGLASERAGRFWSLRDKRNFAEIYLERAINAYEVWGASGKASDLRTEFGLRREHGLNVSVTSDSTLLSESTSRGDALDLSAIIKASQTIAGEIVLEKLLARMMGIVLENSGADRAVLALEREGQFFVEAVEEVGKGDARLLVGEPIQQSLHLSRGIANYVIRVADHVVLDKPAERGRFRRDSYIVDRQPKSVLCAPVSYKGKLRGVIYLENNHVAGAFTPRRLEALNILMSQIAVSIENAMLYEQQERQTQSIERANQALTEEVAERKRAELELSRYRDHLEDLVVQRTRELERAQGRLVDMSRQAGMAEVAAGVLHNVGNVMNSVNVGVHLAQDAVKTLQVDRLRRIAQLLTENSGRLGEYLTTDPAGQKVPLFLSKLADAFEGDKKAIRDELSALTEHVEHMKQIIAAQQSYAKVTGVSETCKLEDIVESAVAINAAGLRSYDIEIVRDYDEIGLAVLDRHQIMQIVVNLISNAKHALGESDVEHRVLTIRMRHVGDCFRVEVSDNGIGIDEENLKKVFNHGFTTKPTGHGFGLHNSANAAQEMEGSLEVFSDGTGKGASFVLSIPARLVDDESEQAGAA